MFSCCQSHQNIDILAPRIINKAAEWQQSSKAAQQRSNKAAKQHSREVPSQQLSSQAGAKMPRYQDFLSGSAAVLRTSIRRISLLMSAV